MTKVIVGMTMSIDGYVEDRSGSAGVLYADLATLKDIGPLREDIENTGAVVMGRKAFGMAKDPDSYAEHYEFQVPIFVLTHSPPSRHPKENDRLTFTFVNDGVESAITQAQRAARGKQVTVIGGASTVRQCIEAGLMDELHLDIMPLLLRGGLRLFEGGSSQLARLERVKVVELPGGRTHLRFRLTA